MRSSLLALLAVAVAVALAAACGGGGSGEPAAGVTAHGSPLPAPETGEVLAQFITAAGRGDAATMWSLLSARSRNQLGPTEEDFVRKHAESFQQGLGTFAGTPYETPLAVVMPSGWGVAVVAGERVRKGKKEFATYAAVLAREGNTWRLELGDAVDVIQVEPKSDTTHDDRQAIVVELDAGTAIQEAGLWLDGQPLPATVSGSDGRHLRITGRPSAPLAPGRHVAVAFGASSELAAAGSMPFVLEPNAV